MGQKDISLLSYLGNQERFADFFNGIVFKGKPVIIPSELEAQDPTVFTAEDSKKKTARVRDIIKKTKLGTTLVIFAIENQYEIDYGMPVRVMEYDAGIYRRQLSELETKHKEKKDLVGSAEYLSKMKRKEKLNPVITIVLYYGKEEWDGSKSLLEIVDIPGDCKAELSTYFQEYRMNLVWVYDIGQVETFKTGIKELFSLLPLREEKAKMKEFIKTHREYQELDGDTYDIITELLHEERLLEMKQTNNTDGGGNNMCQAIQEWIAEERAEERVISEKRGEARGERRGEERGEAKVVVSQIRKKCAKGMQAEEIAEILEQEQSYVDQIIGIMRAKQDYTDEQVAMKISGRSDSL